MVVRIRLARFGNKHSPFYNIVVSQARCVFSQWSSDHPASSRSTSARITTEHNASYDGIRKNEALIVLDCRSARGAKPLEVIGTYNPFPKKPTNLYDENANARPFKEISLDRTRAKYWLGVGAQPSDPAWKLMTMVSRPRSFDVCLVVSNACAMTWTIDRFITVDHAI